MYAEQHSPEFELQHKVQILAADSMVHNVVGYNNIIFSANEMLDIGRRDLTIVQLPAHNARGP